MRKLISSLVFRFQDTKVKYPKILSRNSYHFFSNLGRYGFGFLTDNNDLLMTVRNDLNTNILPRHLSYLEKLMIKSKTGWIASTQGPSIADFVLVPRLQWLASGANDGIETTILQQFPALCALIDRFMNLYAVKKYYANKTA